MILVLVCALIFMANYLQFQIAPFSSELMASLNLGVDQFSSLLLAPLLAGAVLSIPSGVLTDRFGARLVISVAALLTCIGAFIRPLAIDYSSMFVATLLIGWCPSVLQAALIKVFGVWFGERTGLAMGLYFASASLGAAMAQVSSGLFSTLDKAFLASATVFALCSLAWVLGARNLPPGACPPTPEPIMRYFGSAIRNRGVWLVALTMGMGMASSTEYLGLLPQALSVARAVDPATAGFAAAALSIGSIVGSVLGPLWCQRFGHVKASLAVIALIGGALKAACWFMPLDFVGLVSLIANGMFGAAAGPLLEAIPVTFPGIGKERAGSAGGVIGSASLAIAYTFPVAIAAFAGSNYTLNLMLEAALFAGSVIPTLLLPLGLSRSSLSIEEIDDQTALRHLT